MKISREDCDLWMMILIVALATWEELEYPVRDVLQTYKTQNAEWTKDAEDTKLLKPDVLDIGYFIIWRFNLTIWLLNLVLLYTIMVIIKICHVVSILLVTLYLSQFYYYFYCTFLPLFQTDFFFNLFHFFLFTTLEVIHTCFSTLGGCPLNFVINI